jgi:hypothetical protein
MVKSWNLCVGINLIGVGVFLHEGLLDNTLTHFFFKAVWVICAVVGDFKATIQGYDLFTIFCGHIVSAKVKSALDAVWGNNGDEFSIQNEVAVVDGKSYTFTSKTGKIRFGYFML